jgi:hypothetical protein
MMSARVLVSASGSICVALFVGGAAGQAIFALLFGKFCATLPNSLLLSLLLKLLEAILAERIKDLLFAELPAGVGVQEGAAR